MHRKNRWAQLSFGSIRLKGKVWMGYLFTFHFLFFVFTLEISGTPGLAFLEAAGNILGRPESWSGRSLSLTSRGRV